MIVCSAADLLILPTLACKGILVAPIEVATVASVAILATLFAFLLDGLKVFIFRRLEMV